MVYFDNCDIAVNGSGLLATSATLASVNNLDPAYILEMRGEMGKPPTDSIRNTLTMEYFIEGDNEPNLEILNSIKAFRTDDHIAKPFPVEVAGVIGNFYLQNYQFSVTPNQIVNASVSYVCYEPLTGDLSPKKKGAGEIDYNKSNSLVHGWTTYVASSGNAIEIPTYKLDYKFAASYTPIYTIGKKFPKQVQMLSASEEVDFERDRYKHIVFSGEKAAEALPNFADDGDFDLFEVESLCDPLQTGRLNISISGAIVTNTSLKAAVGNHVRTSVSVAKHY